MIKLGLSTIWLCWLTRGVFGGKKPGSAIPDWSTYAGSVETVGNVFMALFHSHNATDLNMTLVQSEYARAKLVPSSLKDGDGGALIDISIPDFEVFVRELMPTIREDFVDPSFVDTAIAVKFYVDDKQKLAFTGVNEDDFYAMQDGNAQVITTPAADGKYLKLSFYGNVTFNQPPLPIPEDAPAFPPLGTFLTIPPLIKPMNAPKRRAQI